MSARTSPPSTSSATTPTRVNGYPHDGLDAPAPRGSDPLEHAPHRQPVLGGHEARRHRVDLEAARALPERAAARGVPGVHAARGRGAAAPPAEHGPAGSRDVPQAREPPLHAARARAHAPRHRGQITKDLLDEMRATASVQPGRLRAAALGPAAAPGARRAARRAARDVAHALRLDQPRDRLVRTPSTRRPGPTRSRPRRRPASRCSATSAEMVRARRQRPGATTSSA